MTLGSTPPPPAPTPEPVAAWILGLQSRTGDAAGALALHADPALTLDGQPYRHVIPYFSNLALTAVLDAAPSAKALAATERWVDWSLARIGPRGVPPEHWVSASGDVIDCPAEMNTQPAVDRCQAVDATDSAAATLLDLVRAYAHAGGDRQRLADWRGEVRAAGETLRGLQDRDGLTWARHDYRVKYLMDNAETVRGFRALAALERGVYGDRDAARRADALARRAATGLAGLRDPDTGLYVWARFEDGAEQPPDLDNWYADAVAQVWPLLFDAAPRAHAHAGFRAFADAYDGTERPDWTVSADPSGFDWPAVGMASVLAGDPALARRQVRSLWARRVLPGGGGFASPFTVADAGWLLRAVVATG